MWKKMLVSLALDKLKGIFKVATPVEPTGMIEWGGTNGDYFSEMESRSDNIVSDPRGRVTLYLHKGAVLGVTYKWPNRNYCYVVQRDA